MSTKVCDPLIAMKPENCPVRATVGVICGKWKPLILFYLKHRTMRFNEFRRMIPEAKHKVLTQQLRDLERAGIVIQKVILRFHREWSIHCLLMAGPCGQCWPGWQRGG
jgi:DNA-binding HxlR family transcriptional regulator